MRDFKSLLTPAKVEKLVLKLRKELLNASFERRLELHKQIALLGRERIALEQHLSDLRGHQVALQQAYTLESLAATLLNILAIQEVL
jgi:hypothetical protein